MSLFRWRKDADVHGTNTLQSERAARVRTNASLLHIYPPDRIQEIRRSVLGKP